MPRRKATLVRSDRTDQFSDNYDKYEDEFDDMLSKFKDMLDGHLVPITYVKHPVDLTSPEVRTIHAAAQRAGPRAHEFEQDKITKMLKMNIIESARTVSAAAIVFTFENDGILHS